MSKTATTQSDPGAPAKKKSHLTIYIVVSIVAAIVVALVAPHFAAKLHIGGEIFLRLLKMMVVPLVIASVMNGILGLGDVRKLGRPGAYAVLYYLTTTILAVAVGLIVVNVIRPGVGYSDVTPDLDAGSRTKILEALTLDTGLTNSEIVGVFPELKEISQGEQATIGRIFNNLLLMLVTDNLFGAAVEANLLPLIIFSIIFAGMLTTMGKRVSTITDIIGQANEALMSFIMLLMKVAPIGIFCLVASRFGEAQAKGEFLDEMQQTGWYFGTVLCGLAFHAFITLPAIYWIFTHKNPYRFMYYI